MTAALLCLYVPLLSSLLMANLSRADCHLWESPEDFWQREIKMQLEICSKKAQFVSKGLTFIVEFLTTNPSSIHRRNLSIVLIHQYRCACHCRIHESGLFGALINMSDTHDLQICSHAKTSYTWLIPNWNAMVVGKDISPNRQQE